MKNIIFILFKLWCLLLFVTFFCQIYFMKLYYFSYYFYFLLCFFFIIKTHFYVIFAYADLKFFIFIILVRDYKVVLAWYKFHSWNGILFFKVCSIFIYIVSKFEFLLLWLGLILKTLIILYFVYIECTCTFIKYYYSVSEYNRWLFCLFYYLLYYFHLYRVIYYTTRKHESNDYHLRLQMCSFKLTSTLCLTYDYVKVCRNLDVILLLKGLVVNWS